MLFLLLLILVDTNFWCLLQITCIDIDECSSANQSPCGNGGRCVNTEGGYECLCESGYVLSPDGNSCIDMRKEPCYMKQSRGQCRKPMAG